MLNDVEQKRMRIDIETCRDPDLLAAEARRLQGVIAAGKATLTDEEREAIKWAVVAAQVESKETHAAFSEWCARRAETLRGLLDRLK